MFHVSLVSFSQFNDSTHFYVNYASTGIFNKTNDQNSFVLTNAVKFNVSKENLSLNSSGSWVYGEQQDNLTNNDYSATLDLSLFKYQRRFYYWGIGNYDKSFSLKINNRFQLALGVAYNVFDTADAWLNISDGIMYERSDLLLNNTTREVSYTLRNSLRIRYKWVIKKIIIFEGSNFLQNSLSHANDYNIISSQNLSVKLRKWLSLTSSATYNKLKRTNRENLLITYGLTMDKYF